MINNITVEKLESVFTQVEQAKQQWEAAVDALPELICVINESGEIIRANRAIEEWTHIPVTEVEGKNLHKLLHPDCEDSCYFESIWGSPKRESTLLNLVSIQKSDSILGKHLSIRARRIEYERKRDWSNMIVIIHDVTRQQKMEKALRDNAKRFKVLNTISKSILIAQKPTQIAKLVLDKLTTLVPFTAATIVSYDPTLEKMSVLGISGMSKKHVQTLKKSALPRFLPEAIDQNLRQPLLIKDVTQHPELYATLEQLDLGDINSMWNIPLEVENRFIGSIVLIHTKKGAFLPGHFQTMAEVAKLLTVGLRQIWLRKQLESSNSNLQNMLRSNQEQLQTVSHELRSPLGIIKGYTEMLQQGFLGPLTEEQKNVLEILDKKGDQLLQMVQSLFTLQKVNRSNLQLQEFEPYAFLYDVVSSWQIIARNKELKLLLNVEQNLPKQCADINLLNQVISNLLDNAVKFSKAGDTITIAARRFNGELHVSISDEGKGIPSSELKTIFERFYQLDKGSAQAQSGAGIGLALCQAIIKAHGGRIWAESEGVNKGTTFSLILPLAISN